MLYSLKFTQFYLYKVVSIYLDFFKINGNNRKKVASQIKHQGEINIKFKKFFEGKFSYRCTK